MTWRAFGKVVLFLNWNPSLNRNLEFPFRTKDCQSRDRACTEFESTSLEAARRAAASSFRDQARESSRNGFPPPTTACHTFSASSVAEGASASILWRLCSQNHGSWPLSITVWVQERALGAGGASLSDALAGRTDLHDVIITAFGFTLDWLTRW